MPDIIPCPVVAAASLSLEEPKPIVMKNEPVVSYDHMQEEGSLPSESHSRHSFNLYLLFVVDVMVISAIIAAALKIIF